MMRNLKHWLIPVAAVSAAFLIGTAYADRDGSGTYTVPNTFVSGETITAAGHNENWSDAADEITNSLPRDGQAGMTGQFDASSGTASAPGISFTADQDSGLYRSGSNTIGFAAGGSAVGSWDTNSFDWTGAITATTDITATDDIIATDDMQANGGDVGFIQLAQGTSTSSTISFVLTDHLSEYTTYKLYLSKCDFDTDDAELYFRTSTNAGSSYDSGASDYTWMATNTDSFAGSDQNADDADDEIELSGGELIDNTSAQDNAAFEITISGVDSTTYRKHVHWTGVIDDGAGNTQLITGGGSSALTTDVDAFRVFPSSGSFASCTYQLYGIK